MARVGTRAVFVGGVPVGELGETAVCCRYYWPPGYVPYN
jgi:hypothetical protein